MTNETIAEIIAKMRNEGHTGPADALEWVREKMTYYADILEAAHKREVQDALDTGGYVEASRRAKQSGNVAKLCEAVGYIAQYADSAAMRQHDATTQHYIEQMRKWATAALAAPARNCDKYATADEALKAQEQMFNDSNFANGECKLGCPECDNPRVGCKIAWLFAPATEKEGGAK